MKKILIKIFLTISLILPIGAITVVEARDIPSEYILSKPQGSIDLWIVSFETPKNDENDDEIDDKNNDEIKVTGKDGLIELLKFIQNILLKVALPVVAVGVSIYTAYELLTAEWNEAKMKKAWSSVVYGIIAIICILLSYTVVSVISSLSF